MTTRWLKVTIWCLPVCLLAGLLWLYLAPTGVRTVTYTVGETSPYVQRLLPDARVSEVMSDDNGQYVTLLDEPVYFSVTPPPGNFDTITVTAAFDPGGTPTLELGGLKDIAAQAFDFRPLANTILEDLAWVRHDLAAGLAVFSRDPKSSAYQTFLQTPPDRSLVATYRATFPAPYREAGYAPWHDQQTFDVSLRGPHELLTYIKNEDFNFSVTYTDVNRTFGVDDGFIKVFDENGNLMTEKNIRDDGNIYDNQEPSVASVITLHGQAWPEGVYRIVLSGTSDGIWRSFTTTQRYLVVKNRVFIADDVGYLPYPRATSLTTNAQRITLETQHREGLQTVTAAQEQIVVDQVGPKYTRDLPGSGVYELHSPVGDIKVTGDGKYAFSRQAFFDPDPTTLTAFTELEASELDYVLANLAPVAFVQGWREASASFSTSSLAMENGAYKFALSAPGIHDNLGQVKIHALTAHFAKSSGTRVSWSEIRHLVKLLLP